jgi:hypothetical protein
MATAPPAPRALVPDRGSRCAARDAGGLLPEHAPVQRRPGRPPIGQDGDREAPPREARVRGSRHDRPRYFAGAPTWDQAKRIFWADLKRMVPRTRCAAAGKPSVVRWGADHPALARRRDLPARHGQAGADRGRAERRRRARRVREHEGEGVGRARAPGALGSRRVVRPDRRARGPQPLLRDREKAQAELASGRASEWGYFHWKSADILPAKEIAAARRDLDELTFQQEYEASFVNFEGRAYYAFTDANKARPPRSLYPAQPLIIMLDFNVAPGVAAIAQELRGSSRSAVRHVVTCVIGEVWIENNSNTPAVCRKILADWGPLTRGPRRGVRRRDRRRARHGAGRGLRLGSREEASREGVPGSPASVARVVPREGRRTRPSALA